jgi:hypothetical protein
MKDFKKMVKMADGGSTTPKFKKDPSPHTLTKEMEEYQNRPDYFGYEDVTPVGVKAREAVGKAYREAKEGNYDLSKGGPNNPRVNAVRKAAQNVIAKDQEQRKTMSNVDAMGNAMKKGGGVSLAIGRGEKLPASQGAGLTAKGRAKYNAATGSNLKAPQPQGGARKDSFCARMSGVKGPMKDENGKPTRKAAALKRWKCGN